MSTVLWSNALIGGEVTSDQEDLYALYKHMHKLDAICRKLGVRRFSSFQDHTDMLVNLEQVQLPGSMESTDELMATKGHWSPANEAADVLAQLLAHIEVSDFRFGLLRNARDDVIEELKICTKFARETAEKKGQFNFAVVM